MCVSYEHVKLADSATAFRLPQVMKGLFLKFVTTTAILHL
jgi:hypothetical protein